MDINSLRVLAQPSSGLLVVHRDVVSQHYFYREFWMQPSISGSSLPVCGALPVRGAPLGPSRIVMSTRPGKLPAESVRGGTPSEVASQTQSQVTSGFNVPPYRVGSRIPLRDNVLRVSGRVGPLKRRSEAPHGPFETAAAVWENDLAEFYLRHAPEMVPKVCHAQAVRHVQRHMSAHISMHISTRPAGKRCSDQVRRSLV